MLMTAQQVEQVRAMGLYITQRCDGCGKVLSQTFYYCDTAGDDIRFCSRECQDKAMGWEHKAKVQPSLAVLPERQVVCGVCGKTFKTTSNKRKYHIGRCEKAAKNMAQREARKNGRHEANRPSPDPL